MIARRFVTSILLLTVVANTWAFALPKTEERLPQEGPSFHLVSLKTETVGSLTRISIESNSPPLYTVIKPADNLIVVDLPGADASQLTPWYSVKSATVDSITVRKSQALTKAAKFFGASIEIKVQGQTTDKSILQGNTLVVEVAADKAAAQENKKAVAKPGVHVEPAPVVGSAIIEPTPVKTSQPVTTAVNSSAVSEERPARVTDQASAAKPATLVRNLRSESGEGYARIIVEADGNAAFKDFVLTNPYRIVLDITGVRNQAGNKSINVGMASVDKVRLGQPSANVVRVVVDAKSQIPYQVEREGASLVITLGDQLAARAERARAKAEVEKTPAEEKSAEATLQTRTDSAEVKVAGQRIDNDAAKAAAKPTTTTATPQANKPLASNNKAAQPSVTVNTLAQAQKPASNDSQAAKQSLAVNNPQPATNPAVDKSAQVVQPSVVDSNTKAGKPSIPETLNAQAKRNTAEGRPRVAAQPSGAKTVKELTGQPGSVTTVADTRPTAPLPSVAMQQTPARPQSPLALCEPDYRGGLISFDLRAGVDLRDMLRFVSQQYGVNFIVDQSVKQVPVDIRVNDLPWNYVLNSVMRANRLGWVCDQGGIVRIMSLDAIAQEASLELARREAENKKVPLVTKILHLKYARAAGTLGAGVGSSSRGSGVSSGGGSGLGTGGQQGGLLAIAQKRLSPRGTIEMDARSNSIIVTDLPEYIQAIEDIIAKLDKPEAQVEIEARIVIASRNFLRDIGVELAAGANTSGGKAAFFGNAPVQFTPGTGVSGRQSSSGSSGGSGSGGGSGSTTSSTGNLVGPTPTGAFAATAGTVLSLTTGIWGTTVISAALSLQETKGQIRTIASPRVTVTDNQPAEIVNGVQIPVQTVSNNTITTTFVTAALRLQITPQIIEENSEVLIRVVAENNTVNFNLANQFNNGTPGINTQSAESTVRVPDGGTTVMGGINIDAEGHTIVRTPGVSRIPLVGELFKRRTVRRDFDEILFFITPRIIRNDNLVKPKGLEPLDGRVTSTTPPTKVNPPKQ